MIRRIARIESTMLGFEDHGVFTAILRVDYGGSAQGVGLFAMSSVNEPDRPAKDIGKIGEFLIRVLRAVGVDTWEQVKGRTVYVLFDDDTWNTPPRGIENLPTESGERFLFAEWQQR